MIQAPARLAVLGHGILKAAEIGQAMLTKEFQQLQRLLAINRPEQIVCGSS